MGSSKHSPEILARKTYFKTIIAVDYLTRTEGPVTVGKLQSFLDHSESAITYQLQQLEDIGIIIRERDPEDKRRSLISFQPEGLTQLYVENYLVDRANRLIGDLEVWNSQYLAGLQTEVDRIFNLNTPSVRKSLYENEYFLQAMGLYISTYAHLTFEIAHAKRNESVDISIRELFDHISKHMGRLWIPESDEELEACADEFKTTVQAWERLNRRGRDDALLTFQKLVRYGDLVNVPMSDVSIAGLVVAGLVQEIQKK